MIFPNPNHVISSWRCQGTLYAIREDETTAFYLESNEEQRVSYRLIKNAIGWVDPREIETERQQKFYKDFEPLLIDDGSTVMFCLFIKKTCGLLVGFLANRKVCVQFFPTKGLPFLIEKIEDINLPTYEKVIKYGVYSRDYGMIVDYPVSVDESTRCLRADTFQLFVKGLEGKTFNLNVKYNTSIGELALEIQNRGHAPADLQRLIFAGKQINDRDLSGSYNTRTLLNWNIQKESCIHLVLNLKGGGSDAFSFNHMENEKKVAFGEAPSWRTIIPGLNLKGTCTSNIHDCEAGGQTVWIQKGIGVFDMDKESLMSECPSCSKIASNINNAGFYDCLFSIQGEKENGDLVNRLNVRAPDNELLTFEDTSDPSSEKWDHLIITTTSIPKASNATSTSASSKTHKKKPSKNESSSGCTLF